MQDEVVEWLAKALVGVQVGLHEDGRDVAVALLVEMNAAGYRVVKCGPSGLAPFDDAWNAAAAAMRKKDGIE